MISCKDVTVLASRALDKQLSLREKISIRAHLFMCHTCARYVKQLRFLHRAATGLDEPLPDQRDQPVLSEAARIRIKKSIRGL